MWQVSYERHFLYVRYRTSTFRTKHYWLAWVVYKWWAFCYLMTSLPVKQVCIYKSLNGITFLSGSRWMVQNREQLEKLRPNKKVEIKFRW